MSAINEELRAISDAASETVKILLQMAGITANPEEHSQVRKLAGNAKQLFNATLDNRNLALLHKGQRTGFVSCTTQDKNGVAYTAPMKLQFSKKGVGEDGESTSELNAFTIKNAPYVAPDVRNNLSEEQYNELIANKLLKEPVTMNFKGVEKQYLIGIDPDLNVAKLRSVDAVKEDIKRGGIKSEELIDRFIKGDRIEHQSEDGKEKVAFYDTLNLQFVSRPISIDKQMKFNRTLKAENLTNANVTANYRQAIVIEVDGKNGREAKAFMLKNVVQGVAVKDLYEHIQKSEFGKFMQIQDLPIEQTLEKGVSISIKGNDLIDRLEPNKKYVIDLKDFEKPIIMKKSVYEAAIVHERATQQLENKQHLSLESKDLNIISTKVVDEKFVSVAVKPNEIQPTITDKTNENDKKKGQQTTQKVDTVTKEVKPTVSKKSKTPKIS
jgi:hypothetical protein